MKRTMPAQKPGRSEQVVVTPDEFMRAVKSRLGIDHFCIDLAANDKNTKANRYYSSEVDSLVHNWRRAVPSGWAWLNPPYSDICPWVQKALLSGRHIAVLVPASVGSNWWRDYVHDQAFVLFLNGRIQFEGHTTGYPKDLALILYGLEPGYDIWRWKE